VRITVGRLERRLHDANADVGQGPANRRAAFGISVADQDPVATKDTIIRAGQHPRDLKHEGVIRMWRRSHEMHAPRLELDDKERVVRHQPAHRPHLGGEEIRGGDRAPVGGQKRAPRHRPLRHWADPVSPEDRGDGGSSDAMSEVLQGALTPAVAARGILPRHPDRQVADLAQHTGASHASSLNGPFARDELPVPPQDRIRGHQGGHIRQDPSAQTVTGDGGAGCRSASGAAHQRALWGRGSLPAST